MHKMDPRSTPSSLASLLAVLTPQLGYKKLSQPPAFQEALLQGHKGEPALPLLSPSCLPGHLVKPGSGPRESPSSLLFYRLETGDEGGPWKALRYRCGVGTAKSLCISYGKFSSFHCRDIPLLSKCIIMCSALKKNQIPPDSIASGIP